MSQTSASVGSSNRIDLPASSSHVSHFRFMFSLTSVTVNALDDRNVFQALLDEFPPWHVKPFFFCCCCCCSSGRYPCLTRLTGATEVVGEQAIRQAWEVRDSFPCSFLGYVMAQWKLQPCPAKIRAGEEWPRPTTRKQLQHFLGFTNFYRRFIRGYSCVAVPLSKLTSIGSNFTWSPEVDTAFQRLNPLFTKTPVLQHPNPLPQTEEISLW